MSQPVITLYDIQSTIPQPWAPNIWRIRFILNYKRLPYRTHWIEASDVEDVLRRLNVPPTSYRSDGRPVYTLPVIYDPRGRKSLSNADRIAEYLEYSYPARPIFPEGSRAMQCLFVHYIQEVFAKPLLPIMVPMTHLRLPERSRAHFMGPQVQQQPSQLTPAQREQAWQAVKEQFDVLADLLDKNSGADGDGVVAMGREVSYADFALCAVLIWIEKVAPQDGWARVRQWNGGRWTRLWERCHDYMDVF